jgi:hypothetical protein
MGPYGTRSEARLALADHVARHLLAEEALDRTASWNRPGATAFEVMVAELVRCRREHRQRTETSAYAWTCRRLSALRERGVADEESRARASALEYLLSEASL